MRIEKLENSETMQDKIDEIFVKQAQINNVDTNYQNFAYAVKDDSDNIVGGIHGHRLFREVYVAELCMDESIRGQGIGRKLIETVEREICNDKCDYIVLTTNAFQKAIKFYEKCGFEVEFVRRNITDSRFDKYYMIKKLK